MLTAVEQKITPSVLPALRLALIIRCQQSNYRICLLVTSSKRPFSCILCLMQGETSLQLNCPKPTDYMSWLSTARGQRMVNRVQILRVHDTNENGYIFEGKKAKKWTSNYPLKSKYGLKCLIFNIFKVNWCCAESATKLNMTENAWPSKSEVLAWSSFLQWRHSYRLC